MTVGVAYARLDYRLHREFASLGAHGSAGIASLYASYPLVRSYNRNLTLLGGVDYKVFEDYVDSVAARSDKHSVVGYVGLSGDSRDTFGGGGANFFSAIVSGGSLDIRSPDVRAIDALTTGSDGGFAKLNLAAGRTQSLSGPLSLYVAARGQIASKNLDISEKMELGGDQRRARLSRRARLMATTAISRRPNCGSTCSVCAATFPAPSSCSASSTTAG